MATRSLITGGAGFIGSHLAEWCKARGHELIILDNLATGHRGNVAHLLDGQCQLIQADVGRALADNADLLEGVDRIFHLAAAVGVRVAVEDPLHTIANNVTETATLLEHAARRGIPVLFTSSSEVYGRTHQLPMVEDQDLVLGAPQSTRWSYALSKATGEQLALAYHRQKNLPVVIVRLFNIIGPRQRGRYGMVVPRFVQWAVDEQDLQVFGDGTQTRTFCDVRDAADAIGRLMEDAAHHGRIFNLGSDSELTINQLADQVIALSRSNSKKRLIPYDKAYKGTYDDPPRRVPDLTSIRRALDFAPRYDLTRTLTDLIELAGAGGNLQTATGSS